MTVWVVMKTLYDRSHTWLEDDFGNSVDCLSEIVGVFDNEEDATEKQEDILNRPDTVILPSSMNLENDVTYVDVIVEEWDV